MSDRKLPGKFVWFELESSDPKRAQGFYGEVLGWKVVPFPIGGGTYEMIYVGDTMIGGYAAPPRAPSRSRWVASVSVEDVDAAAKVAAANGGKVIAPPFDAPGAGRMARIADPQGAELWLFDKATDDPPDQIATHGRFFWNELHTADPIAALAFYQKVVGYTHRSLDMGPGDAYHIVSRGGVDRGGVTHHVPPGVPAHWLPYVAVDDADAAIARARTHGGTIAMGPADIPGIGRFGVIEDPTGAVLAVMKPAPTEKKP